MSLRIGFLMDPLEHVQVHHDTTFALMREAQARGHDVLFFEQHDLYFGKDRAHVRASHVELSGEQGKHFRVLERLDLPVCTLDAVFLRKDPPVDVEFLHATLLLDLSGEPQPLWMNSPAGLRDANEKLFSLGFPALVPKTLVAHDPARLRAFVEEVGGDAILKPIDGFGGKAILRAKVDDPNLASMLEIMTSGGTQGVVAQEYLARSREGDKRILVLDGEPLGAVLRVPRTGEVRANMAAGGEPRKSPLDARDREICAALAPALRERGLYFVGIDVIGGYLTEVNVTSPTGVAEINALDGVRLERDVLAFVEGRCEARAKNRLRTVTPLT